MLNRSRGCPRGEGPNSELRSSPEGARKSEIGNPEIRKSEIGNPEIS